MARRIRGGGDAGGPCIWESAHSPTRQACTSQLQATQLGRLSPQLPLAAAYLDRARIYARLSPERRTQLCQELLEGIAGFEPSAAGGAASTAGRGTPAGRGAGPAATPDAGASQQEQLLPTLEAAAPATLGPAGANGAGQQQGALPSAEPAVPGGLEAPAARAMPAAEPTAGREGRQAPVQAAGPPGMPEQAAPDVQAQAAPPSAEALGMGEWTLTYAEQCQKPFQRPDLSTLRQPVPVVFDLETSGETRCTLPASCMPAVPLHRNVCLLPMHACAPSACLAAHASCQAAIDCRSTLPLLGGFA